MPFFHPVTHSGPAPELFAAFKRGLSYDQFLDRYGSPKDRQRWAGVLQGIQLDASQRNLLADFRRKMCLLCMAGTWCGDCVEQCPILHRFAQASPCIDLRFVDRDADAVLAAMLRILGSPRVPQVVFLSQDGEFLSHFGDRTLARYRYMASRLSGAACPSGIVAEGDALQRTTLQQWLDEVERVQLMLLTSPKLRQQHGD